MSSIMKIIKIFKDIFFIEISTIKKHLATFLTKLLSIFLFYSKQMKLISMDFTQYTSTEDDFIFLLFLVVFNW